MRHFGRPVLLHGGGCARESSASLVGGAAAGEMRDQIQMLAVSSKVNSPTKSSI